MKKRGQWGLVEEDASTTHAHAKVRDKAQGPRSSIQPYIRQNSCQLFELSAQFNRHQRPPKEKVSPKAMYLPGFSS